MERSESLRSKYYNRSSTVFYRLLYAGIFSMVMLFCFSDLFGISNIKRQHIAVLLVSIVVFCVVCLFNGRQRVYATILGGFVFLFLFLSIGSERCLAFFWAVLDLPTGKYLSIVKNSPLVNSESLMGEQVYIELGRVFLLAVACCLLQFLLEKKLFLKIISADIVGGWLLYMLKAPKAGVIFFILYTGLIVTEWIRSRWKKMKNENVQVYILGILPFLVVYIVLLCFMPMQAKPYDWQWAKNIYHSAEEKITMYAENFGNIGNEYFSGTTSGFSEEGTFFPDILQDNRQLMTLGIGKENDISVYLTGKVFDTFNGREWESLGDGEKNIRDESRNNISGSEKVLDVIETVCALESYAGSYARNYYKNIDMDVSYQYFHTNYLLAPSKTWRIGNKDKKVKYHQEGVDLIFDRKAGYGTEYTLRFCQLNMDREQLYWFLNWYRGGSEEYLEIWTTVAQQYSGRRIPIEELYTYWEEVREQYLPETNISPEVKEWLAFVTADATSDMEALQYIESALSGMEYNMSPGKLPEKVTDEESFLDYFLLEKREGYCAHYATAFVLLARAEGFPARYVQGFCVPTVNGDETHVYSDMAHAWPEVYIQGKGWIPFEPTPGFGINRYTVWEESADGDGWSSYTGTSGYQAQEHVSVSGSEMTDGNIQTEQSSNHFLPYFIRIVCILLIGSILAFGVDRLWEKYRNKKRKISKKYRLAVLQNLQVLEMLGYKRGSTETYHELAERIRRGDVGTGGTGKENDKKSQKEILCEFIETYEHHLYGTLEINNYILDKALKEREQLLAVLKKRKRKTYLLCRIRLYVVRYR